MKSRESITTLFLDIGGVLLTNSWDHEARALAANVFHLDPGELEHRHHLTFDTYESGKLSLDEYLERVVFYEERTFSADSFRQFMFELSKPLPRMSEFMRLLKAKYGLKIAVVSNEGRELTEHRIQKYKLNEFVDFFIASCFVHVRKPDADIYRIALDIAQVPTHQVVYIEDRLMFVEVAQSLGIRGIHHKEYRSTRDALASLGLSLDD